MNEKIKTQIYLKASKVNKRGEAPLYVQVRLYGKAKLYSTSKFISPNDFDKKRCVVKSGGNAGKLNAFLRTELSRMDEVILNLQNDRIPLTFEAITERFENPDITFYNFSIAKLNSTKDKLAKKTFQKDEYHLNFINKAFPEIRFHQVTKVLLEKMESIARKNGHSNNTIHGHLKTFRKYFYLAKSAGLIKNNPFDGYPIKQEEVKIDYLTMSEIIKLYDLYMSNTLSLRLKKTLNYYLFSCFTGLRPIDLRSLNKSHIVEGTMTKNLIKTKVWATMPLSELSRSLINLDSDHLFVGNLKKSESRLTEDLKIIFELAGLNKEKTNFYTSRHTFAVNSLDAGLSPKAISDLMGHKSIRMTERYCKVTPSLKRQEVGKWDAHFEKLKALTVEVRKD